MEPEGSLPHSQDLATGPSPGPYQHEALRSPSLSVSPVIIFVKCMRLFYIRTRSSWVRHQRNTSCRWERRMRREFEVFTVILTMTIAVFYGVTSSYVVKNTSALQRRVLHEVSPKRRQIYIIRLRGVTFQLIAFFKRRGSWWKTGRGEDCDKIRNGGI